MGPFFMQDPQGLPQDILITPIAFQHMLRQQYIQAEQEGQEEQEGQRLLVQMENVVGPVAAVLSLSSRTQ